MGNPTWGNPPWGIPMGNPTWGNPPWGNPPWGNPPWGNLPWGIPHGGIPHGGFDVEMVPMESNGCNGYSQASNKYDIVLFTLPLTPIPKWTVYGTFF